MAERSPEPSGRRRRTTRKTVIAADFAAGSIIRGGGIFVLVAVLGICLFLFAVFLPLFRQTAAGDPVRYRLPRGADGLLFAELNEYRSLGLAMYRDGTLSVFDGRTGEPIREEKVLGDGAEVTTSSRTAGGRSVGLGLADGNLVLGQLEFTSLFLDEGAVANGSSIPIGGSIRFDGGVVEMTPIGQLRKSEVQIELNEPVPLGEGKAAVVLLSYRATHEGEVAAALSAEGKLVFSRVAKKQNMLTGKESVRLKKYDVPYELTDSPPSDLLLNSRGDQLFIAWRDGEVHRFDLRDAENPLLAEKADLCPGTKRLTAIEFMQGDQSVLAGDSEGGCTAWFRLPDDGPGAGADGYRMKPAHVLEPQDGPIVSFGISRRDKTFATGTASGGIWLRHMTSERVLADLAGKQESLPEEGATARSTAPIVGLQITPKADGLLAVTSAGDAILWPISNPHPETTPRTIFGKVWYEGHEEPVYSWQSSSGTDDFEPKFSLVPLIVGTLKATFYSLLFAVPIAILAAIYTSEFLSPKVRAVVKPSIEMMASLPSVVLGFLAALVLAPWAENWVLSLLVVFFVAPCAMVIAAYLWLFLPETLSRSLDGLPKLVISGVIFILAIASSFKVGPILEELFFLGDFRAWLAAPELGNPTAFWAGLLFPLALGGVHFVVRLRGRRHIGVSRPRASGFLDALSQLARGTAILGGSLALSVALGLVLTLLGLDPRGSLVGTYVQRNTMIVGFVMGFAVIPIIYTIAEDALSSVPQHLRGAALGCGATPWQAAVMVILPTAMSGIFSAVMVGLGRAVGETMIVVMAAGNTPILDVNLFNGLRALSATIAVELPEAVKDGTLYRMLFLAAASLFVMTFAVNTIAEVIRMRFRKRAFEL